MVSVYNNSEGSHSKGGCSLHKIIAPRAPWDVWCRFVLLFCCVVVIVVIVDDGDDYNIIMKIQ